MPKNLYQRTGVWYGRFTIDGQLRRICLRTGDLRVAKARLKALQTKAQDARYGIVDAKTWPDAVTAYTAGVLNTGSLKESTAARYRVSLRQIDPYFRPLPLSAIDKGEIGRFIAARQNEGAMNATIKRDLTTISRVLAFASAQGMTETNAALVYDRKLVRERSAPINAPSDADIAAACAVAPPQWAVLFTFLRATGMRLGEALRVRWTDLEGDSLTIKVTKNSIPRTIAVPVAALPTWPRRGRIFECFPEDSGTVSSRYVTVRLTAKTMPRFRLHDLRHAYAIGEIRAGRDIYDLSHHLGHSSVKVTERYLGYAPGKRSVARRLVAQNESVDEQD
jgi:integrase